jgi:uncharacterized Rmd1/YagE family protein
VRPHDKLHFCHLALLFHGEADYLSFAQHVVLTYGQMSVRVCTQLCSAHRSYRFSDLMKFFNARRTAYRTNPRQIDDVIYTTYSYNSPDQPSAAPDEVSVLSSGGRSGGFGGRGPRRGTASVKWRSSGSDGETTTATAVEIPNWERAHSGAPVPTPASAPTVTGDLLGVPELAAADATMTATPPTVMAKRKGCKWDTATTGEAEIFLFSYGTVVIWGMTEQQEKRFLSSL